MLQLVCNDCSAQKRKLQGKLVRVCMSCSTQLDKQEDKNDQQLRAQQTAATQDLSSSQQRDLPCARQLCQQFDISERREGWLVLRALAQRGDWDGVDDLRTVSNGMGLALLPV